MTRSEAKRKQFSVIFIISQGEREAESTVHGIQEKPFNLNAIRFLCIQNRALKTTFIVLSFVSF